MAEKKTKKELSPEQKARAFKELIIFGAISLLLFAIDIITKWVVQSNLAPFEPLEVIPNFFYITLSYNTGAAFSLGANWGVAGRVLGILISVIMSTAIGWYWIKKNEEFNTFERAIAALMFSGAIGNLIDRAFYWEAITGFNGVIDFFQFYLGGGPSAPSNIVNPFATFNVADACLVVGIILFIVELLISIVKDSKNDELRKDPRLAKKAQRGEMLSKKTVQNSEKPSQTPSKESKTEVSSSSEETKEETKKEGESK